MPDMKSFVDAMKKNMISEEIIAQIINVGYEKSNNIPQDNANYFAKAIPLCEKLFGFDMTARIMFDRACCRSGYRLSNAIKMDKKYRERSLPEKLEQLGKLRYMGHPYLNEDRDIVSEAVGTKSSEYLACPCWRLKGCKPAGEDMPLDYCLCCAGHFMFHYQHALDLKLKVKEVVSSILNSGGKEPCVFIYEIIK